MGKEYLDNVVQYCAGHASLISSGGASIVNLKRFFDAAAKEPDQYIPDEIKTHLDNITEETNIIKWSLDLGFMILNLLADEYGCLRGEIAAVIGDQLSAINKTAGYGPNKKSAASDFISAYFFMCMQATHQSNKKQKTEIQIMHACLINIDTLLLWGMFSKEEIGYMKNFNHLNREEIRMFAKARGVVVATTDDLSLPAVKLRHEFIAQAMQICAALREKVINSKEYNGLIAIYILLHDDLLKKYEYAGNKMVTLMEALDLTHEFVKLSIRKFFARSDILNRLNESDIYEALLCITRHKTALMLPNFGQISREITDPVRNFTLVQYYTALESLLASRMGIFTDWTSQAEKYDRDWVDEPVILRQPD